MGYTSYNLKSRSARAESMSYFTASTNETFKQNVEKKIHELMDPKGVTFRECRDSEAHPATIPISLNLDVTGSMLKIPEYLVRNGLPHMMSNLIQRGAVDASLMFAAIGDHESDRAPLQVGQFESGDEELDLWLTRTWLEGKGGGNPGESYMLAWYFAAFHTKLDAFEKRGKKGFLFTVGDEPCLPDLPSTVVKERVGNVQKSWKSVDLLKEAQKMYEVFHIHVMEGAQGARSLNYWENLLGQRCIPVEDHTKISDVIINTVIQHSSTAFSPMKGDKTSDTKKADDEEIIL
jgi:hypothetical protein